MDEGTKEEIRLLLRRSQDDLETAELLLTAGKFRACISRSYYAMFYAATAGLLSQGIRRSRHSGIQAALHQFLIQTGLIEQEYGAFFSDARSERELSDYDLGFSPLRPLAQTRLLHARQFVARMEAFLEQEITDEPH